MPRILTFFFFAWGSVFCAAGVAQELPAFEVASVRPTTARPLNRMTETRVDFVRPMQSLLLMAFGINDGIPPVNDYRLVGPRWLKDVFVEIHATIPPGQSVKQVPEMVHRLLIERFGLSAHTETRTIEAYHLIVSAEGKKMTEVEPLDELDKSFPPNSRRVAPQWPTTERKVQRA
jgi:uncharacterized protein (TIGR03435 family)